MQQLATIIREQLDALVDQYDARLRTMPGYSNLPEAMRRELERHFLNLIAQSLDAGDYSQLVQYAQERATQWDARGLNLAWFQQALLVPEELLVPLVQAVETSNFVWQALNRSQSVVWQMMAERSHQTEERFRSIVETAHSGIMITDDQFHFIYANEQLTRISGYNQAELIGADFRNLLDEDSRRLVADRYVRRQRGEDLPADYEIAFIRKDGQKRYLEMSAVLLHDASGKLQTVAQVLDVTERKQAETALAQERNLLHTLIDSLPDQIFFKDATGHVILNNMADARAMGVASPAEAMGKNVFDLYPAELAELYHADDMAVIQSGQPLFNREEPGVDAAGQPRWVQTTKVPLTDDQGRPLGLVGIAHDITTRKHTEEALARSADLQQRATQRLRATIETADELIQIPDLDTLYRRAVELAREKLGVERCGLFIVDPTRQFMLGTYGTDDRGYTTDEHMLQEPIENLHAKFLFEEKIWSVQERTQTHWVAGKQQTLGSGWVAGTAIRSAAGSLGILYNDTAISNTPLDQDLQETLAVYCSLLGNIIERKRLEQQILGSLDRREQQVQTSTEVSQEIAMASDLAELLQRVVTLIKERFDYYHAQIFRYDPAFDAIVLVTGYGEVGQRMLADGHRLPMGRGVVGTAAANGQSILATDVTQDADWRPNPHLPETKGELAVPIKLREEVLGILDVQSDRAEALSADDRLLLEGLCGQIAVAMESTRLLDRTETLYRISSQLSAAQTYNDVLSTLREYTLLQEADLNISVNLYDRPWVGDEMPEWSIPLARWSKLTSSAVSARYPLSAFSAAATILRPDAPTLISDIPSDPRLDAASRELYGKRFGAGSTIFLPLVAAGKWIGYVNAVFSQPREFNEDAVRLLTSALEQASTVLESLRRLNELTTSRVQLSEALRIAKLADWEYDVLSDTFTFNDQTYALLRTTAEREGGYTMSSAQYTQRFVHPDDAPLVAREVQLAIETDDPNFSRELDHRIFYADGQPGYVTVRFRIEKDAQGRTIKKHGANQDITERKQAETALRESEHRYQQILDGVRDMILVKGEKSRIVWANKAFRDYYSMTVDDLQGMVDAPFAEPDYTQQYIKDDLAVWESGQLLNIPEEPVKRYDGEVRLFETMRAPILDENGKVFLTVGVSRDITERKRNEEALREQAAFWQHLIDNIPSPIFFKDINGVYRGCNVALEKYLGRVKDQIIGLSVFDMAPPDLADKYHAKDVELFETPGTQVYESSVVYADGTRHNVVFNKATTFNPDGSVGGLIGIIMDITDRKQAEETLNRERNLLRILIDNLPLYVYIKDRNSKFVINNKLHLQVLGATTQEEVLGKGDFDYFPQADAAQYFADEQAFMQADQLLLNREETVIDQSTGQLQWVSSTKIPYHDERGNVIGFVGVTEDITARKQVEQNLQELLAKVQQSERLMRTIIDAIPDNLYVKNRKSEFLLANKVVLKQLGCQALEDLIGKTDLDFYPSNLAEKFLNAERALFEFGQPLINVEEPSLDEQGRPAWRLTTKVFFYNEAGEIEGLVGLGRNITEQKQAEERLQELLEKVQQSEQLMRTLIDAMPDHIYAKDLDGRLILANLPEARLHGVETPDMLLGKSDFDFYPRELAEQYWASEQPILRDGIPLYNHEDPNQDAAGQLKWSSTTKVPLRNNQGHIIGLVGMTTDITARKQVEQQLVAERTTLRALIDNLPHTIYIKDRQSRFVVNNAQHLAVLGAKTQAEVLGKTDYDIFPRELADQYYADEQALMQADQILKDREERVIIQSAGREHWASTTKIPLHDLEGRVTGFVGFTQDITERKQAEQRLQELLNNMQQSEQLMRTVINSTSDWIFIKDQEHRYRLVNQGYANSLHIPSEEFIGKNDLELGFPEDLVKGNPEKGVAGFWADDRAVMNSGQTKLIPNDIVMIDGALRIYNTIKTPLRNSTGQVWGVLAFARDVTEREQLIDEQQKRALQLHTASDVSRAASSILKLDELLPQAVEVIRARFGFYYVGIFLADEAEKWAVLRAGTGESGQQMLANAHRLEIGGASMISQCIVKQQARIALDVGEEAVRFDNPLLPLTHSELALPLISRNQTIGAMTIQSDQPAAFTSEDITVLQSMADQISNAVENARLYERVQVALGDTDRLLQASAELNVSQTYNEVLDVVRKYTALGQDAQTIAINVFDRPWTEDQTPVWIELIGYYTRRPSGMELGTRFPIAMFPAAKALLRPDATAVLEDLDTAQADPNTYALFVQRLASKSVIFVPLLVGGQWFGYMNVLYPNPTHFNEADVRRLTAMVGQAAVAVQNLRNLAAAQQTLTETEASYRATQAIGRAQSIETILAATTHVVDLLGLTRATLRVVARRDISNQATATDHYAYHQVEGQWILQPVLMDAPVTDPAVIKPLQRNPEAVVIYADAQNPNSPMPDEVRQALLAETLRGIILTSVSLQNDVLGFLSFSGPQAFTDTAEQRLRLIIRALSDQIAVALQNRLLFEQTRAALQEVDAINRRLTGEAWDTYLHQQVGQDVIWAADDEVAAPDTLAQLDDQLAAGEIMFEPDPDDQTEATVTAPILLRGQPIGALRLRTATDTWNNDTAAVLTDIAGHIAQAVENARLIEQTQRTASRERAINEINARVRQTIDLDTILRTAVNELGQSLKAARVTARINVTDSSQPGAAGSPRGNDHE